ncbi:MAG: YkgJ family cysteine cluster protein [Candidatus Thorarchaeota archaeon]
MALRFEILLRKVKKEIPSFKGCQRCGQCCGQLKCHPFELEKIKSYLTRNNAWKVLKFKYKIQKVIEKDVPNNAKSCYFLVFDKDAKTSCSIYNVRPIVCRMQGLKSNLRCPHNPAQDLKMTPNMNEYYDAVMEHGVILNSEIEKLLLDEEFMREMK